MKSKITIIATFTLLMTACGSDPELSHTPTTFSDPLTVADTATVDTISAEELKPKQPEHAIVFSDPVNQSIEEYSKIKEAYIAALKEDDAIKIQDLNMQYMDWYQETEELVGSLKGEELAAYKEILSRLNKEWEVAVAQAMK